VGEIDGIHYFTMDYIEGKDLGQIIKVKGKLDAEDAIDYALQVCEALAYAHEQGVVHRDLKPGNVLVDKQGRARIGDFGIAKDLARSSTTQAGEVLGTPNYMPPEQADGNSLKVDGRADIYSLGAVLYEMLTGHPPFEGKTGFAILQAVMNERPLPPSKHVAEIPPDLETIILKCLEKDRELRYGTVADLASDLKRFQAGQSIEAQRSKDPFLRAKGRLVVILAVALAAVLGGGLVYVRDVKQRQEAATLEAERKAKEAEEAANRARQAEAERAAAERATSLVHEAEESALHGDKDHAVQLALDAVERAPKLALAHATLGRLYLELRSDMAKAIEESDAAIGLDKAAVEPHITRARALVAGKRWDEALTECGALEKLGVEGRASAGRVRGETFLARGELDAATNELEHAADIAPRDAGVRVLLARAYLQAKKFEEAERTATGARELDARLVDALKLRAQARAKLPGKIADALADANEAVRLAPSDPEARALVDKMQAQTTEPGNDAEEHKRVDAAAEALRQGDRKPAEAYLATPRTGRECYYVNVNRGFLGWNLGRIQDAEESFSRAHDQNPKDMGTLGNRGLLRMQLGRNQEAIADFDAALANGIPEGLYPALIGRNKALAHLKRWEEAEKGWVQALELFKEPRGRASALHDRAKTCWMARQRWAEAESDLSEAIALAPGVAHYWCDRGIVREKKGDREGALADWKAALDGKQIEPNDEKTARESIKRVESP
jgi:tetratricopeptide (TPR) repeat protein